MRKQHLIVGGALIVVVLAAAAAAGLSSSSGSAGGSSGSYAVDASLAPGSLPPAGVPEKADGAGGTSGTGSRLGGSTAGSSAGGGSGGGSGGGRAAAATVDLATGTRILTADISVAIDGARHVGEQADAADAIAVRAGGVIDGDERTSGDRATATLSLRVPPERLKATLDALAALGTEVSRHSSGDDVTQQVADVRSRVDSATRAITRLRLLYDKATHVSDIIAIEAELSARESDLESLQAQQQALARQTAMASITVSLAAKSAAVSGGSDRTGFLGGLQRGWDAFTDGAAALAVGLGAILPFLVLALVLLAGARLVRSRVRGRATPLPTE